MKALRDFFTNGILIFFFLAWIFVNIWMFFGQGGIYDIMKVSGGKIIPDISLYQSADNLTETLSAWGAEGRLNYKRYQFRDFIYPMVYATLLIGLMVRLIRPKSLNIWLFFPLLALIFDFIENYFLRIIVYDFPYLNPSYVSFASVSTFLKWVFVASSILIIILAYRNRRKKYIREQEKKERKRLKALKNQL
jgi:hypothetical protein